MFLPSFFIMIFGDFQLWRELVTFPNLNLTLKRVVSIKKISSET